MDQIIDRYNVFPKETFMEVTKEVLRNPVIWIGIIIVVLCVVFLFMKLYKY